MRASQRWIELVIVLVPVVLVSGSAILARVYPWPETFHCFGTKQELPLMRLSAIYVVQFYRPVFQIMCVLLVIGFLLCHRVLRKSPVQYEKYILFASLLMLCGSWVLQYLDMSGLSGARLLPPWYHCNAEWDSKPDFILNR